jgi:hypothetical protein
MNHPTVYLSGPISGLTYDGAQSWREYAALMLAQAGIVALSPLRAKQFLREHGLLEGSYNGLNPLATDQGITTRDRNDTTRCSLVLVNLLGATDRVSIGTCMEIAWADLARVPVVLAIEPEGNIHDYPMIRHIAGFRVDNLPDALQIATGILLPFAPTRSAEVAV